MVFFILVRTKSRRCRRKSGKRRRMRRKNLKSFRKI